MPLSRLGQVALPVSDVDRAEAFYGRSLGLTKLFRFGELVFFHCAGVRLMLERSSAPVQPTHGTCHYFKAGRDEVGQGEETCEGCEACRGSI